MKYVVQIDDQAIEVEVDGERVVLDGQAYHATLGAIAGTPLRQLMVDGRPVTFSIESLGRGRWALTRGGDRLELEVLDERTRHIRSLTGGGDTRKALDVLKAPMPGLVVRIPIKPGDAVTAGMGLVVLEAMKMENELTAPGAAIVKAVRVAAGEAVEKGQVLLEFESDLP
jgi:biotin carboxyl carrier protein